MTTPRAVAVFGSSQTDFDSTEWDEAVSVGARLASAGLVVVTGGYGGTMEAVSLGAAGAGGRVVGVTAPTLFPDRVGANPHIHELIEATSLAHRIDVMMERADATLSLPGSIGTATELLMAWNINHIKRRSGQRPLPCAAVGGQWKKVADALVLLIGAEIDSVYWAKDVNDGVNWVVDQLEVL
ncbi:MAG TPA: LOG family protein [Acidimicrobiia bacterium]|nr:LOG family protein [Acidimicrobiia bacterium]